MNIRQEKHLAIVLWAILLSLLSISTATLILLMVPPQETTQKQHNFPIGDDTEHTWIGGDGESFEE